MSREELEIVYGGNYEYYQHEVISLLEANGNKILKSKYAKSVSAWIYSSDDYVTNNDLDEKQAEERIGRKIPSYHLIDVWKLLKADFSNVETEIPKQIEIHPVNNRVPLSQIRNKNNWEKGFDDGFKYWEQGDAERKTGNIEEAIRLFDKARYNGYFAPVLYNSYAMAYRKLKDLDNEIDILTEGIERYRATREGVQMIVKLKEQRKKAIAKLQKERK
ncbi:MAG: tetratricopeptide repeat protein [Porphyromonadaceae bacterium]|nr:tetratricopeptide repeat protein [Porphyromonadaceae bacterium]